MGKKKIHLVALVNFQSETKGCENDKFYLLHPEQGLIGYKFITRI